ncbi:MAG: queuosine precursor transporter [Rhodobacteraceae bacterium]|nr:queuosine precursor transporter [Paracoccaceae bacterium]
MTAVVVASNILVQFLVGNWLTWGAFVYPVAFLVTDVINRAYGPTMARRVIAAGFMVGVFCSAVGSQIDLGYGPLVTLRIAIGSGTAFLCAQLLDIAVFNRFRSGRWWRAPLVSSLVGSLVDTAIFFTIAFSASLAFLEPSNVPAWAGEGVSLLGIGPQLPLWVSLAAADFLVKLSFAGVMLLPFRLISARLVIVGEH